MTHRGRQRFKNGSGGEAKPERRGRRIVDEQISVAGREGIDIRNNPEVRRSAAAKSIPKKAPQITDCDAPRPL